MINKTNKSLQQIGYLHAQQLNAFQLYFLSKIHERVLQDGPKFCHPMGHEPKPKELSTRLNNPLCALRTISMCQYHQH
jgi:hypothetical protein